MIEPRFSPPVSKVSVITCVPPASVTGTLTVAHACQPPVAGTPTAVDTLPAGASKATCSAAPFGEATRNCSA